MYHTDSIGKIFRGAPNTYRLGSGEITSKPWNNTASLLWAKGKVTREEAPKHNRYTRGFIGKHSIWERKNCPMASPTSESSRASWTRSSRSWRKATIPVYQERTDSCWVQPRQFSFKRNRRAVTPEMANQACNTSSTPWDLLCCSHTRLPNEHGCAWGWNPARTEMTGAPSIRLCTG